MRRKEMRERILSRFKLSNNIRELFNRAPLKNCFFINYIKKRKIESIRSFYPKIPAEFLFFFDTIRDIRVTLDSNNFVNFRLFVTSIYSFFTDIINVVELEVVGIFKK